MKELVDQWESSRRYPPQRSLAGYEALQRFTTEIYGDVVRAYLAAADAASKLDDHVCSEGAVCWRREYEDFVCGKFVPTDEVAIFILDWIQQYHEKMPPGREGEGSRHIEYRS